VALTRTLEGVAVVEGGSFSRFGRLKGVEMAVSKSTYRLTQAVTAVVCKGTQKKLESLGAGSIIVSCTEADRAGMIEAACGGLPVMIFRRDLEERSVNIAENSSSLSKNYASKMLIFPEHPSIVSSGT
jgi:hypothetical protein